MKMRLFHLLIYSFNNSNEGEALINFSKSEECYGAIKLIVYHGFIKLICFVVPVI